MIRHQNVGCQPIGLSLSPVRKRRSIKDIIRYAGADLIGVQQKMRKFMGDRETLTFRWVMTIDPDDEAAFIIRPNLARNAWRKRSGLNWNA